MILFAWVHDSVSTVVHSHLYLGTYFSPCPVEIIFWWGHGLNRMRTTAVNDISLTNVHQLCIKIIQTSQSLKTLGRAFSTYSPAQTHFYAVR